MADFVVCALFVFVAVIFILDRLKLKTVRRQSLKNEGERWDKLKTSAKSNGDWLNVVPGPKPFPWHFIGNVFQLQPVNSKQLGNTHLSKNTCLPD